MSRRRRSRRKPTLTEQGSPRSAMPQSQSAIGYDAASWTPDRCFNFFPLADPRRELSDSDLALIYRRARSLYANFPEVRQVVETRVLLQGVLMPRATTKDKEWNRLAREEFLRVAMNPALFDASGRLNFLQAQAWIERRAIIDGDCLTVLVNRPDGFGGIRLYAAPQVADHPKAPANTVGRLPSRSGVTVGRGGRVTAYHICDWNANRTYTVPAERAILYGHNPDPADPRHVSELVAAITTAQDVYEINQYHKTQVKIGATFGVVETKNMADAIPGASALDDEMRKRLAERSGVKVEEKPAPEPEQPLVIDNVKAISLPPGRDLKMLHNSNPSHEVRAFVKDRTQALAYGLFGIDPALAFDPSALGSASVRFMLAKAKDAANRLNEDRKPWATRIWQHIIANAIAAGRLRTCRDPQNMWTPIWLARNEWSIDLRHDVNSFIALRDAGLASGDIFTLSHYDLTMEEVAELRAEELATLLAAAEKHNIPRELLIASRAGAAPIQWEGEKTGNKPPIDRETE